MNDNSTRDSQQRPQSRCRLCGGELTCRFELRVLNRHVVRYFHCERCLSLQSEPPYWLEAAYSGNNLSNLDTGAVQRNLQNFVACLSVVKFLKLRNVLDVGGGDGLLCRLLRDYEINCFVRDKYATPTYAQGFEHPDYQAPDLVIAFEVLEHYPNPSTDLDELFEQQPNAVLASTAIFTAQDKDWWYLAPESGQHVFFYSREALEMIADKYGYDLLVSGGYLLFVKRGRYGSARKALAKVLLKSNVRRLSKAWVAMLPTRGVWKDRLLQVERARSAQKD